MASAAPLSSHFRAGLPERGLGLPPKTLVHTPASSKSVARRETSPVDEAPVAVQAALHKTVAYTATSDPKGALPGVRAAAAAIEEAYVIPAALELDKLTYGPLSGQTRADRIVAAYELGALSVRIGHEPLDVCYRCGLAGHRARYCSSMHL